MPAKNYTEQISINGNEPQLKRVYHNGKSVTLKGDRALANADAAAAWQALHPEDTALLKYRYGDERESTMYQAGRWVGNFADNPNPTLMGRIANMGSIAGGLLGGTVGGLGGALAGWLRGRITGNDSTGTWGLMGLLGGGALGAASGYVRTQNGDELTNNLNNTPVTRYPTYDGYPGLQDVFPTYSNGTITPPAVLGPVTTKPVAYPGLEDVFQKKAAMFHDPRNFILEKLQGANDIGYAEKAKLAAAVRKLDPNTASRLADAVRAAVGFGIGSLIAKFIFGAKGSGILFGGLAGVLGGALLKQFSGPSHNPVILPQSNTFLPY